MIYLKKLYKYDNIFKLPLWRNWYTHMTQNHAGNHVGSSPTSGIYNPTYVGFFIWAVSGKQSSGLFPPPATWARTASPLHFLQTSYIGHYVYFVPKILSPASPRPGTMYPFSLSFSSTVPTYI